MACQLHAIDDDECVFLANLCQVNGAQSESGLQSMNALLGERQWNRAVVDLTKLASDPTALELFEFAENLCFEVPKSVWIAILVRFDQEPRARLLVNVARNRGRMLGCFTDARNATAWLKSGRGFDYPGGAGPL